MNPCLHPFRSLGFLCLAVLGFTATAQDKPCKPFLKANRHKTLVMSDPLISTGAFEYGNRHFSSENTGSNDRNITVTENNRILAQFTMHGGEIAGKVYREYDASGTLLFTDSLDPEKGKHRKTYMEFYSSNHVVSSSDYYPGGRLARRIYYSLKTGHDSLQKEWYPNGLPKNLFIKNRWQSDSVIMRWDDTGILREHSNSLFAMLYFRNGVLQQKADTDPPHRRWIFYENGILESLARDTVISGGLCREYRSFYPNGILRSVEYYSGGYPCLTWSVYTTEGILKQKLKKGPVIITGEGLIPPVEALAPEIFTYVEEMPEYPGGNLAFRKELEKRFVNLVCISEAELSGVYRLRFKVNTEGRASYEGLEGANAEKLSGSFASLFSSMIRWKPGKQNGRAMTIYFGMDVTVKKN